MLWPDLPSQPKLPAAAPALTRVLSCCLYPDGFPFSFLVSKSSPPSRPTVHSQENTPCALRQDSACETANPAAILLLGPPGGGGVPGRLLQRPSTELARDTHGWDYCSHWQ